ncbi:uncharacterized protein GGS22DRAFT_187573 [Annulohypoxylon maeteangense]|uniref:uncharacterized protein n=1 Tax=Annulohypoxylon maeteangense TaxID=1927788 RepID=UPI0020075D7F|nr:uncharacterized protein GGS22DRAFT_187573 [Annulohypoxylon maeteangense]KAI0886334.1 hypothetical protein GGS22DRAFT_187573 [Annulohypoxylon maeteangense]
MPSAQPTCAARIVRNNFLKYGWGATLSKETNDMVARIKEDAGGMYQMQISRDRPISSKSLRPALFWEHRHLADQKTLSTPQIDDDLECDLFSVDEDPFEKALDAIRKSVPDNFQGVQMHPMFGPMRNRPYTIWPIRMDGVWVTVILQIETRRVDIPTSIDDVYLDRIVSNFVVIDPVLKGRDCRLEILEDRLPRILLEGCIELLFYERTESFLKTDIEEKWATGLVSYAMSREFIRRLRVLLYRKGSTSSDFLWDEFEEDLDFDVYRQLLMAACANQTIEKSGHNVRLAIEVPSAKSEHNPDALLRTSANEPDEEYKKKHYTVRNVLVKVPVKVPNAGPDILYGLPQVPPSKGPLAQVIAKGPQLTHGTNPVQVPVGAANTQNALPVKHGLDDDDDDDDDDDGESSKRQRTE